MNNTIHEICASLGQGCGGAWNVIDYLRRPLLDRGFARGAQWLMVLIVLFLCNGCGTAVSRGSHETPAAYSATKMDMTLLGAPVAPCGSPWFLGGGGTRIALFTSGVMSLPFDFIVDTVALPYDLSNKEKRQNHVSPSPDGKAPPSPAPGNLSSSRSID